VRTVSSGRVNGTRNTGLDVVAAIDADLVDERL
jgi:hypothetical protein